MKLAGTRTPALGRLIALAIIALGVAALAYAWHRSANYPPPTAPASTPTWSTSPRPSAAAWSACRSGEPARRQGRCAAGDRPRTLPPDRAAGRGRPRHGARASLESRRRMLISERANSAIADEQLRRAEANHALAARTVKRLAPLAAQGYIPTQQYDQSCHAARRRGIAEAGPATAGGRRQHHRRRGRGAGRRAGPRGRPGARPPLAGTNRGARPTTAT